MTGGDWDPSSIAGDLKYFFGSHHVFLSNDRDERPLHRSQPHVVAYSIGDEEAGPGRSISHPNKESACILPLRGNEPNPSVLHEPVLQPQPASHTMSENSPLCDHPETTPTDPLCHARVMSNRRRCPGTSTLEEEKSRPWCVVASVWTKTRRVPRPRVEPGEDQLRWAGGFSSYASLLLLLYDFLVRV